jgi:hypothetical protein
MKCFDEHGNQIQYQQWLKTYEPYYFLNGPTRGNRITSQRQTSPFVENRVFALLTQTTQLSKLDLILAMAWKIGEIDHPGSEAAKNIKYLHNWPTALKDRYRHDFSVSIPSLAARMPTILTQVGQGNPQYVFDLLPKLEGFGYVYILTVLFFVTHGRFPIYDRYAHIAALAIDQGLPPGSCVTYRDVQKWSDFQHYMNLLLRISKACPQQLGNPPMFISRPIDRALWVYGHFFETKPSTPSPTRPSGGHSAAPVKSASNGVLFGRIRDLCQITRDGWRRREIIVCQATNDYPKVGDCIHLVDSSGAHYSELPFIKGAGVQGFVCLGKPGALKLWFTRQYPLGSIKAENVYFEPTGLPNEYRIYSESEWKSAQVLNNR